MSHESKNRENNKSSNETGATVQQGKQEDIPEKQTQKKNHHWDKTKATFWVQSEQFMQTLNPVIIRLALPVAIVLIVIVAGQDNQRPTSQTIREHDLGYCVLPNLESKEMFNLKQF